MEVLRTEPGLKGRRSKAGINQLDGTQGRLEKF